MLHSDSIRQNCDVELVGTGVHEWHNSENSKLELFEISNEDSKEENEGSRKCGNDEGTVDDKMVDILVAICVVCIEENKSVSEVIGILLLRRFFCIDRVTTGIV